MGNVSKRQQPDHRANNSRRPPMGLQCSEKLPYPEASFSWPLKKYVYYFSDNGRHTKLRIIHKKLKLKIIQRPDIYIYIEVFNIIDKTCILLCLFCVILVMFVVMLLLMERNCFSLRKYTKL